MKIAIIGAMDEEVQILKDNIENRKEESIAGSDFWTGSIDGVEVILLKSGIGKVNAAVSTTILLDRFEPNYVINTGSAGGFNKELNVGDIVISSEVVHHDVDVTAFGYEYGQVPQMPAVFRPDRQLVDTAKKAAKTIEDIQVGFGLIATGDSFIHEAEQANFIREKFANLYAVEMEASAIAQVCHRFNVPFVIIRALSDIAGKESNVSFEQFLDQAALHSTMLVRNMLNELS